VTTRTNASISVRDASAPAPDVGDEGLRRSRHATIAAWGPPLARLRPAARRVGRHVAVLAAFTVPSVVLWWHVWTGHPASTLTCGCGDPAQQVWFTAWPAWAIAHAHDLFFSDVVNVPDGANLLSNTSGTLVGAVLAPVTWLWGPVVATNVALTLAPALSAWGCYVAVRRLVLWRPAAIPAALVYGYSAAVVTSLALGHVSVSVLAVPPLLFVALYEIVVVQERTVWRDGLVLATLLVVQFFISPEVLVMCLLFCAVGLVAVVAAGWRQVPARVGHALPALGIGAGIAAVVLAYPTWYGLAGPQAVDGVLFSAAPVSGVALSGVVWPGAYAAAADAFMRFGGYLGRSGPPPDYLGGGLVAVVVASVVVARRRLLTWILLLLALVALWLSLGSVLTGVPSWLTRVWLPWRILSSLPVLREIVPDQFAPFLSLFVAFLVAVGLNAFAGMHRRRGSWVPTRPFGVVSAVTAGVAVLALAPVVATFDIPYRVVQVHIPPYVSEVGPTLPAGAVLLTVPFASSGSSAAMLWQAESAMHWSLAGAALKTPGPLGGPVQQGAPGSARRILSDLTVPGSPLPTGTQAQLLRVRRALLSWRVGEVVIAGVSRDPVYTSGFFTMALGTAPRFEHQAWVWTLAHGVAPAAPATGASLAACRAEAVTPGERGDPLAMSRCVLAGATST